MGRWSVSSSVMLDGQALFLYPRSCSAVAFRTPKGCIIAFSCVTVAICRSYLVLGGRGMVFFGCFL